MTRPVGRVGSENLQEHTGRVEKSQKRSGGQVVWRQAAGDESAWQKSATVLAAVDDKILP